MSEKISPELKEILKNYHERVRKELDNLLKIVNEMQNNDFYKNLLVTLLKEYFIYREKIQYFQSLHLNDEEEEFLWEVLDESTFVKFADLFKENFKVIYKDGDKMKDFKCEYIKDLDKTLERGHKNERNELFNVKSEE